MRARVARRRIGAAIDCAICAPHLRASGPLGPEVVRPIVSSFHLIDWVRPLACRRRVVGAAAAAAAWAGIVVVGGGAAFAVDRFGHSRAICMPRKHLHLRFRCAAAESATPASEMRTSARNVGTNPLATRARHWAARVAPEAVDRLIYGPLCQSQRTNGRRRRRGRPSERPIRLTGPLVGRRRSCARSSDR